MTRRDLRRLEVPFGALGAAVIGAAFWFGAVGIPEWLPSAPLLHVGIASPLSGMTRSFVAMANGDLAGSFAWHPLGPPAFVAACAAPVVVAVSWLRGRRIAAVARVARSRGLWLAVAFAFAAAWFRQSVAV